MEQEEETTSEESKPVHKAPREMKGKTANDGAVLCDAGHEGPELPNYTGTTKATEIYQTVITMRINFCFNLTRNHCHSHLMMAIAWKYCNGVYRLWPWRRDTGGAHGKEENTTPLRPSHTTPLHGSLAPSHVYSRSMTKYTNVPIKKVAVYISVFMGRAGRMQLRCVPGQFSVVGSLSDLPRLPTSVPT